MVSKKIDQGRCFGHVFRYSAHFCDDFRFCFACSANLMRWSSIFCACRWRKTNRCFKCLKKENKQKKMSKERLFNHTLLVSVFCFDGPWQPNICKADASNLFLKWLVAFALTVSLAMLLLCHFVCQFARHFVSLANFELLNYRWKYTPARKRNALTHTQTNTRSFWQVIHFMMR